MIQDILRKILRELIRRDQLQLVEGASEETLVRQVTEQLHKTPGFQQYSRWLSSTLLASSLVEELYASDEELFALLGEIAF